jgi:hypothetical protein
MSKNSADEPSFATDWYGSIVLIRSRRRRHRRRNASNCPSPQRIATGTVDLSLPAATVGLRCAAALAGEFDPNAS